MSLQSCLTLANLWTVACGVPLSMGFSRQEYWRVLPRPSPQDFSDPGIKPMSLMSSALAGGFCTTSTTWEAPTPHTYFIHTHTHTHTHIYISFLKRPVISSLISRYIAKYSIQTGCYYFFKLWKLSKFKLIVLNEG